jgi:hypothetical protein
MFAIFLIAAAIVGILPTLLVFFIGQMLANNPDENLRQQNWALFWLATASLLMLPYAIFARNFLTSAAGLVLSLVAPTLWCALGLLLINWQVARQLWQSRRVLVTLLLSWLLVALIIIALGSIYIALFVLGPSLLIALLWGAGRSLGIVSLLVITLLLVAVLLLDATGALASHNLFIQPGLRAAYKIVSSVVTVLALCFSAIWVYRAYKSPPVEPKRKALYLGMALLLVLCACAVTLRHGLLTKATGRASEDHFPFGALAAALASGLVLAFSLKDTARRAGIAFLVITPLLIVVSFSAGFAMNPVVITEGRLARINQAVQSFHQDVGVYPPDLATLVPVYAKNILGPLTGRGQVWCYQAGNDYYRLGYVWYQRYYNYPGESAPVWEPYYEIKIPYAAGAPPSGEWMCDQELRWFKQTGGL